jgi:hypothetical protein
MKGDAIGARLSRDICITKNWKNHIYMRRERAAIDATEVATGKTHRFWSKTDLYEYLDTTSYKTITKCIKTGEPYKGHTLKAV